MNYWFSSFVLALVSSSTPALLYTCELSDAGCVSTGPTYESLGKGQPVRAD